MCSRITAINNFKQLSNNSCNNYIKVDNLLGINDAIIVTSFDVIKPLLFLFLTFGEKELMVSIAQLMVEQLVLCNYGVIGETLQRRSFWILNEDILKITILKINTMYPSKRYGLSVAILHEGFKSNTPYPGTSIRHIKDLLYMKLLEDIKRGLHSKKA
ncbi:hypothetical protein Tco_0365516 [Tanacetum coccineum]